MRTGGNFMHGRWRLLLLLLVLGVSGGYVVKTDRIGALRALSEGRIPEAPGGTDLAEAPASPPVAVQTTIAPPIEVRIADTAGVVIEAGRYLAYRFSGDGRSECRVRGGVRVVRGGDRRVGVTVVDREGAAELEAGRTPRSFYDSGPVSETALDFNVDGRTSYTLVVSNVGSGRAKTVRLRSIVAACAD